MKLLNPKTKLILLDNHKIAYIEVPKAGCSSIKLEFSKALDMNIEKSTIHKSIPKVEILHREDYKDYFIFSFVRNPFSRILSAYKSKILPDRRNTTQVRNGVHKRLFHLYGKRFYGGMTFKEFVTEVCEIPDEYADIHFISQAYLLFDSQTKEPLFDFCGKLENMSSDFAEMNQIKAMPFESIGHFGNKTSSDHYSMYYDNEMVRKMVKRYKADFRNFDYRYDNQNPSIFKDPMIRDRRIDLFQNKEKSRFRISLEKDYPHKDEGYFYMHLYKRNNPDEKQKITFNWNYINNNAKIEDGKTIFFSRPFDPGFCDEAQVGHRSTTPPQDLWYRIINF